jgi:hypothetical protein
MNWADYSYIFTNLETSNLTKKMKLFAAITDQVSSVL